MYMDIYTVKSIEDCFGAIAYMVDDVSLVERREDGKYIARIVSYSLHGEPHEDIFEVKPCYDHKTGKVVGFVKA